MIQRVAALVLMSSALLIGSPAQAQAAPPNVLLIVTDDQRWDSLWAMPTVQAELVSKGVTFTNAFASNPLCCPSRASILTGQYSHTTGVWSNGGFSDFDDSSTLATWLDEAGYGTALIGKYLNGYPKGNWGYTPPGWDQTRAVGGGVFYDYKMSVDGRRESFGHRPADYATRVLRHEAIDFIRDVPADRPLFLYWAPTAPHGPATPDRRDMKLFDGIERWRPESYMEADVSDKPKYIRKTARFPREERRSLDEFRERQLESLRGVDRAVAAILAELEASGRLENTIILFMSDNGYSLGEHRWRTKVVPYEESIRIPMILRWDALGAVGSRSELVGNVDVAPTIAEAVGVPAPRADGLNLLSLLHGRPWRTEYLIEHAGHEGKNRVPDYCGVRTQTQMYVQYESGREEAYDLVSDPLQLQSNSALFDALRPIADPLCDGWRNR